MYYGEASSGLLLNENGEEVVSEYEANAEFQKIMSAVVDERYGVSSVAFDLYEELIWVGNHEGRVASFYGHTMEKYTSFAVHMSEEIRQIICLDEIMCFLSASQLRGQIRRGIPVFTHTSDNMTEMQCSLQTGPTTVLMGGHQNTLVEFDLSTTTEIRLTSLPNEGTSAILRAPHQNRYILSGDPAGSIYLLDNRSYRAEQSIEAHNGSLSDFDINGNLMVTCGFSSRQGNLTVDRFIKVYDIRTLRAMAPIPVSIDPLLLRFLPGISSRIATVSANGQMEILETQAVTQENICIYQVSSNPTGLCTTFDISSSGHQMTFGDSAGGVTLFSSSLEAFFNPYSRDTEFADPPPEPINLENASLSSVPLYYSPTGEYLSDWPADHMERGYRKTPTISQSILNSMKMVGTIGYAPNPGLFKRNQVLYKMNEQRPKKAVKKANFKVPKRYIKATYIYDDHDKFCGLDGNLVNSYCNAVLQVLCHFDYFSGTLMNHYCPKESCLSCELGFLFKNMTSNMGVSGVGNFLRVFRTVPEASALGLILNDNVKSKLCLLRIIQNWSRFILHQVEGEMSKYEDPVAKLFAMNQENTNRCTRCGREEKKQSVVLLSNLLYPSDGRKCNFVDLLQRSLCPEQTTPAWCDKCEKYQPTFQSRTPKSLPDVLCLNTGLDNAHDFQAWKNNLEGTLKSDTTVIPGIKPCRYGRACTRPDCKFWHEDHEQGTKVTTEFDQNPEYQAQWLPVGISVTVDENSVLVVEDTENPDYELCGVVIFVKDENEEKCNLVAVIRVGTEWNLFNDFMVRQVKPTEATHFNPKWKIPAIVYYRKKELPPPPELVKNKIPIDVFKRNPKQKYKTLTREENNQLVALDAEFVTVGQEETELRSDGKLATIKPQQLSVGRVTVIRENGQALMDDYISTQEVVVDYLTKFSGIQPGDLDANYSSKNVTSLKVVYSKLCYLIEQGVKFVGHGISNDFRVINLVVPPDQVADTVTLFYLPNQRMVSLRFLAWHYLGLNIQTEVHDSLEDARAALYLYRKYEELKEKGEIDKSLEELYEKGKKLNWKVPI